MLLYKNFVALFSTVMFCGIGLIWESRFFNVQEQYLNLDFVKYGSEHFKKTKTDEKVAIMEKLMSLKLMLALLFFSEMYNVIKAVFFYQMNHNSNHGVILKIFGTETDLAFSSLYYSDLNYFNQVEYAEYILKLLCCYIAPIYVVLRFVEKHLKEEDEEKVDSDSVNCGNRCSDKTDKCKNRMFPELSLKNL